MISRFALVVQLAQKDDFCLDAGKLQQAQQQVHVVLGQARAEQFDGEFFGCFHVNPPSIACLRAYVDVPRLLQWRLARLAGRRPQYQNHNPVRIGVRGRTFALVLTDSGG